LRRAAGLEESPPAPLAIAVEQSVLSSICGTCVDLPEPVGACSTSRRVAFNAPTISLSISYNGQAFEHCS